jgi:acylphosphatase
MNEYEKGRIHVTVDGRVQGVSFRFFVVEQADMLNLNGWVRNRWAGSVEVCAEGSRRDLEQLIQALRQGPPMARVDALELEWQPYTGEFKDFQLKSTA